MKKNMIMDIAEAVLVLALIACMLIVMFQVSSIQGTARVVNYAGIVRGATQRLVKLELMGRSNIDLSYRLDGILEDLQAERAGANDLILLPDAYYKQCLETLASAWVELKDAIERLRNGEDVSEDVLSKSERYFNLADTTVSAAEIYSQGIATRLQMFENAAFILMALEIILIIYKSVHNLRLVRRNRELGRMAYIDAHTGLPNKSRCMAYMKDTGPVPKHTAVFMFDLNFLKRVNDELGHEAGDSLIKNFAMLLRNEMASHWFVGRFGGDEFIVVAHDTSEEEAKAVCEKLEQAKARFNDSDRGFTLSFSYGYALSDDFNDCTYKTLFDKADHNMYQNKRAMKAKMRGDDASLR